jgi:isopentenyl phosphate kinase
LASRFSGRKIIVFGAGSFARCVFKNYDLSKLNIVAIADRRFEENRPH